MNDSERAPAPQREQEIADLHKRVEAITNFSFDKSKGPARPEPMVKKTPIAEFRQNFLQVVETADAAILPLAEKMLGKDVIADLRQRKLIVELNETTEDFVLTDEGKVEATEKILKAIEEKGLDVSSEDMDAALAVVGAESFPTLPLITGLQVAAIEAAERMQEDLARGEKKTKTVETVHYVAGSSPNRRKMPVGFHYEKDNRLVMEKNMGGIKKINSETKIQINNTDLTYNDVSRSLLAASDKGFDSFTTNVDLINKSARETLLPFDDLKPNFDGLKKLSEDTTMDPRMKKAKMDELREPIALRIADWGASVFGTESKLSESIMIDLRSSQAMLNLATPPAQRLELYRLQRAVDELPKGSDATKIEEASHALVVKRQEIYKALLGAGKVTDSYGAQFDSDSALAKEMAQRLKNIRGNSWSKINDQAFQELEQVLSAAGLPADETAKLKQMMERDHEKTKASLQRLSKRGHDEKVVSANMNSVRIDMGMKGTRLLLERSLTQEEKEQHDIIIEVEALKKADLPTEVWEYGVTEGPENTNEALSGALTMEQLLKTLEKAAAPEKTEPEPVTKAPVLDAEALRKSKKIEEKWKTTQNLMSAPKPPPHSHMENLTESDATLLLPFGVPDGVKPDVLDLGGKIMALVNKPYEKSPSMSPNKEVETLTNTEALLAAADLLAPVKGTRREVDSREKQSKHLGEIIIAAIDLQPDPSEFNNAKELIELLDRLDYTPRLSEFVGPEKASPLYSIQVDTTADLKEGLSLEFEKRFVVNSLSVLSVSNDTDRKTLTSQELDLIGRISALQLYTAISAENDAGMTTEIGDNISDAITYVKMRSHTPPDNASPADIKNKKAEADRNAIAAGDLEIADDSVHVSGKHDVVREDGKLDLREAQATFSQQKNTEQRVQVITEAAKRAPTDSTTFQENQTRLNSLPHLENIKKTVEELATLIASGKANEEVLDLFATAKNQLLADLTEPEDGWSKAPEVRLSNEQAASEIIGVLLHEAIYKPELVEELLALPAKPSEEKQEKKIETPPVESSVIYKRLDATYSAILDEIAKDTGVRIESLDDIGKLDASFPMPIVQAQAYFVWQKIKSMPISFKEMMRFARKAAGSRIIGEELSMEAQEEIKQAGLPELLTKKLHAYAVTPQDALGYVYRDLTSRLDISREHNSIPQDIASELDQFMIDQNLPPLTAEESATIKIVPVETQPAPPSAPEPLLNVDTKKEVAQYIFSKLFAQQAEAELSPLADQAREILYLPPRGIDLVTLLAVRNPDDLFRVLVRAVSHEVGQILGPEDTSITTETLATMARWDEVLKSNGKEFAPWLLKLVQLQAEGADIIAHIVDIPLNRFDLLPKNLATRLMAKLAEQPGILEKLDEAALQHFALLGVQEVKPAETKVQEPTVTEEVDVNTADL